MTMALAILYALGPVGGFIVLAQGADSVAWTLFGIVLTAGTAIGLFLHGLPRKAALISLENGGRTTFSLTGRPPAKALGIIEQKNDA